MSSNNPWMAMRSLTRDGEVTKTKLAPGTVRRIAGFAKPYKFEISIFLVLVVVDAVISVAIPLLFRVIIDEVDTNGSGNRSVVIGVALAIAGIAIFDAGLSLIQRYFSARVGEGLIYDLRTRVFGHVQRMPVAFFTRTQTGALVSRLNTDVIGAQQAITSTLSSSCPTSSASFWSSPRCSSCPGRSRSARWCCCRSSCCPPAGWVASCRASPARRCSSTPT